ncbi:oligosaccharide flippase family protein [Phenylobacterium sp. NIBR 498073]|nr:oligosaccharide flippase family protein [Phenylobacterium sp. NIBR 498073]WGU42238.1 oligosaccharide flippase family protein [Phenylobacterium sp. NIBR 498073]
MRAYVAASVLAQVCSLARYTIMARLLGPEQLGLAALLILTSSFFESVSDNGSDRFMIQDPDGDKPEVQKLVQLVFVGRGVFIALGLLIAAYPMASLYHEPALATGLIMLAAAPLIGGWMHLDFRRAQRTHDFRPEALGIAVAELASTAAIIVAAYFTRDFTAILYGLITRPLVQVIISHLTAKRRYAIGYAKEYAQRLAMFAGPLVVNGLLLFVGSQGDRVLIGHQLGVTELGHYTAVLLLVSSPAGMVSRVLGATNLPVISAARAEVGKLKQAADRLAGRAVLLALGVAAGFALVAPFAVELLYGPAFHLPVTVVALIGMLQSVRFIRLWPNNVALGVGASRIVMSNNIARMVALPAAIVGFNIMGGLPGVLVGFIFGEFTALIVALMLLNRHVGFSSWDGWDRVALFAAALAVTYGGAAAADAGHYAYVALFAMLLAGFAAWAALRERETITEVVGLLRTLKPASR